MTVDPLERPVWNSLTGPQAHLAQGGQRAVRLDPDYGPFAAVADRGAAAQAALAGLLRHDKDWIVVVEQAPWPCPAGLQIAELVPLVQMVRDHDRPVSAVRSAIAERLGDTDVADMDALVAATEPGPWASKTHLFGDFYGIREVVDGGVPALIAIAGERFRPAPGLAELSGVCTAVSARGRGLAAAVIERVVAGMQARDERAFLHCCTDNVTAIRLYRTLGFEVSREMVVTAFARG